MMSTVKTRMNTMKIQSMFAALLALVASCALCSFQAWGQSGLSSTPPFDGQFRTAPVGYDEAYLAAIEPSSHAANLLELQNGDVLCAWFSGSAEGRSGVAIVVSRLKKGARQWSRPEIVDRREGYSYQNPVLFEAASGELWLIHTAQPEKQGQAEARVMVVRSKDHGQNWSAPVVLFDQAGAFVRHPMLVRADGAWLLPMYYTPTSAITTGAESHYPVVKLSSDQGKSWTECRIPAASGLVQPSVVRVGNQYVAFLRSRFADNIYRSTSPDGCTWTAPEPTPLANNNSSVQAFALQDGRLVIIYNDAHAEPLNGRPATGARVPLSVAVSADGGRSWPLRRNLENGLRAVEDPVLYAQHVKANNAYDEYSYPAMIETRSGELMAAFTWRRQTIKVVRFRMGWIGGTAGQ